MQTPKGSYKIRIKDLREAGLFNRGKAEATITLSESFKFKITYSEEELIFSYSVNGDYYNYSVNIIRRESNLGRGEILLFECPVSFKPCRVLYFNHREEMFTSMKAIRKFRYPVQNRCNRERYNIRYWEVEEELQKLYNERQSFSYKGKKTRRLKRIERLEERQRELNYQRFTLGMPVRLQKLINNVNLNNLD